MAKQERRRKDDVVERNVAGMRELLERKKERNRQREAEPPREDDPFVPSQENELADEATGVRGSTGGIRNMGGGRP